MNKKSSIVKLSIISILVGACSYNVLASENVIKAQTSILRSDTKYNTNPWNTDRILGAGENGIIELYTQNGKLDVPVPTPLYSINDTYSDRILFKDGKWGIERRVKVKIFDGNENWELYNRRSFKNDKTIIFKCQIEDEIGIRDGISTHFDMHTLESQQTNIYDGISFGENNNEVLMRFMNVRNIKTVEGLKEYLKNQKNNGNPVKLFYVPTKFSFEPFSDSIQKELINNKILGISGKNIGFSAESSYSLNTNVFLSNTSNNPEADFFLHGINKVEIYDKNNSYYVYGIYPYNDGVKLKIKNKEGKEYTGNIDYKNYDFKTDKESEILCYDDLDNYIRVKANLSKMIIPENNISGLTYSETGFKNSCYLEENLVLPESIMIENGNNIDFRNAILYGHRKNSLEVLDEHGNVVSKTGVYNATKNETLYFLLDNKLIGKTNIVINENKINNNSDLSILFIGDSIINEGYYTKYFKKLIKDTKIQLLGTRGYKGENHEGRGGWSAFDYCNVDSKYGYSNPFLNNGKFDFSHYMEVNNYGNLDYVVINLGINDTNLVGHNSNEEILNNFDKIVKSIHEFDTDIKIIINTPEMPFLHDSNADAKNRRLELTKCLFEQFDNIDNIIVAPTYLYINGFEDFKFTEPIINDENQDYSMVVKDATHMNIYGYKNLASGTYNIISTLDNK